MCLENRLTALTSLQRYQEADESAREVCKLTWVNYVVIAHPL